MARNVALVAFGIVVGVLAGAAVELHAESDMSTEADLTGVDGSDQVAVPGPTGVVPDLTVGSFRAQVWDRLAACESTSRWHLASGNGFFGGLQFDRSTWLAYGGGAYATRADYASREQQIAVAEKVRAVRGFQPWPACSRALGLRP
jgi:Transglycosylase-like domain